MQGVVVVRKTYAVNVIIKRYRLYRIQMRGRNKRNAVPVIATFLKELMATMKGAQYHLKMFLKKTILLQNQWRNYSALAHVYYQTLLEAWNKVCACKCAYAHTHHVLKRKSVNVCKRTRLYEANAHLPVLQ